MREDECRDVRDDLSAYLDGELYAIRHAQIEEHLARCPECREVLNDLQHVSQELAMMRRHAAPAELLAAVLEAEPTISRERRTPRRPIDEAEKVSRIVTLFGRLTSAAALIAVGFVGAWFIFDRPPENYDARLAVPAAKAPGPAPSEALGRSVKSLEPDTQSLVSGADRDLRAAKDDARDRELTPEVAAARQADAVTPTPRTEAEAPSETVFGGGVTTTELAFENETAATETRLGIQQAPAATPRLTIIIAPQTAAEFRGAIDALYRWEDAPEELLPPRPAPAPEAMRSAGGRGGRAEAPAVPQPEPDPLPAAADETLATADVERGADLDLLGEGAAFSALLAHLQRQIPDQGAVRVQLDFLAGDLEMAQQIVSPDPAAQRRLQASMEKQVAQRAASGPSPSAGRSAPGANQLSAQAAVEGRQLIRVRALVQPPPRQQVPQTAPAESAPADGQ